MCYCTLLRQVQAASLALWQTDTDEFDSMPLAALQFGLLQIKIEYE